jgi:hypothetical protein
MDMPFPLLEQEERNPTVTEVMKSMSLKIQERGVPTIQAWMP